MRTVSCDGVEWTVRDLGEVLAYEVRADGSTGMRVDRDLVFSAEGHRPFAVAEAPTQDVSEDVLCALIRYRMKARHALAAERASR